MEHLLRGIPAEQAWDLASDEQAAGEADPRSLPGARRASLRFVRHSATLLEVIAAAHPDEVVPERELHSADGTLAGTPDLVLLRKPDLIVIDHKTSAVSVDGITRPQYERQLRIYAGLAAENHDRPASRAILLSTKQGAIDVDVAPPLIDAAMAEARAARAAYNDRVPGEQPAKPSASTCRWCPYRARCDAFWGAVDETWAAEVGECTRALLSTAPEVAANGLAAFLIEPKTGPMIVDAAVKVTEVPFDAVRNLAPGQGVAITGLRRRQGHPHVARWTEGRSLLAAETGGS